MAEISDAKVTYRIYRSTKLELDTSTHSASQWKGSSHIDMEDFIKQNA